MVIWIVLTQHFGTRVCFVVILGTHNLNIVAVMLTFYVGPRYTSPSLTIFPPSHAQSGFISSLIVSMVEFLLDFSSLNTVVAKV